MVWKYDAGVIDLHLQTYKADCSLMWDVLKYRLGVN
jgi:hypothetical protein